MSGLVQTVARSARKLYSVDERVAEADREGRNG